jgi:plasmid stability protein
MEWQELNPAELLVAEQAVLMHREVLKAVHAAPHGRGLEMTERAVLTQGRRQMALMMGEALKAAAGAQKKGSSVLAADERRTATTPRSSS